ncbi:MAG TPA: alpha/beta fold hydrolase [Azospirillaceae bacterium]|nr:alpha/beta fold hydrolase [Azospirillaceae bacterium]
MAEAASAFPEFRPRWPWHGPHLQTLRNFLRRTVHPLPAGEVRRFPMEDGTGDVLLGTLARPDGDDGRPLAVLLHGLTGCEDSAYIRATAAALLARGYPVLRLNLRAAGPSRPLCREHYYAGRSGDLRRVLAQLAPEWAGRGVVLAGYSLGANMLLKFMGEGDFPLPVRAAAAVSAPIDLADSSRHFQHPSNRFYHRWLLAAMKREWLAPGRQPLEARWRDAVLRSRSIWEFDDLVVGPMNGWDGAEAYYRANSAAGFMGRIAVPTLVVHALDDPWIPPGPYRRFDWAAVPALHPLLPAHGGHVGFHGKGGVWHDRCIAAFFERHR